MTKRATSPQLLPPTLVRHQSPPFLSPKLQTSIDKQKIRSKKPLKRQLLSAISLPLKDPIRLAKLPVKSTWTFRKQLSARIRAIDNRRRGKGRESDGRSGEHATWKNAIGGDHSSGCGTLLSTCRRILLQERPLLYPNALPFLRLHQHWRWIIQNFFFEFLYVFLCICTLNLGWLLFCFLLIWVLVAVPVRTASDQPYRLQKFKLRLFYASDIRQPNLEVISIEIPGFVAS